MQISLQTIMVIYKIIFTYLLYFPYLFILLVGVA